MRFDAIRCALGQSLLLLRKLLAPFTGGQRWWVAIGLALYGIARRNIFLLPIAGVALVMLTYSLISSFVR